MKLIRTLAVILSTIGAFSSSADITILDLGSLSTNASMANAINNQGQVVGASWTESNLEAFSWTAAQGMVGLGVISFDSEAVALNDNGQVIGNSGLYSFVWDPVHGRHTLESVGNRTESVDINDEGQIVGVVTTSGMSLAFVWEHGVMTTLDTLGGNNSIATGINNLGQIFGAASNASNRNEAFVWENGVMIGLGTPSGGWSGATDGNEGGQVVGSRGTFGQDGASEAFLWSQSQGMKSLGVLPGKVHGGASAINNRSQIVGTSYAYDPVTYDIEYAAFLVDLGKMLELSTLPALPAGWTLLRAHDINESGQIVGLGLFEGEERAYLMTVSASTQCPADCAPPGGDGVVDMADLVAVLNDFSTPGGWRDIAPSQPDGTVGNGEVNIDDLVAVLNAFGSCPYGEGLKLGNSHPGLLDARLRGHDGEHPHPGPPRARPEWSFPD